MSVFDSLSAFTPHGFCLAWQPGLIWLMAGSDAAIATAYFSIPAALVVFLHRRRDLAFKPVFFLFAAFILACGTTHVLGTITLWLPIYWLDGAVKALTASLSVATAVVLWPLLPRALALPSPDHLKTLNDTLAAEIAKRDIAVAKVRLSQERQGQFFARSPAAISAVDAFGTVLNVSDSFLELTGRERDDVIGRNICTLFLATDAQDIARDLAELRAGRSAAKFTERRMLRADGQIRHLECVATFEHDEAGRLQAILAAATDITARKETEAALRTSEEHLRQAQKMEAVGQLTGGIAHDFNNLLTTIMGSLELLEQRPGIDARGMHLIASAIAGSRRAAKLTSQLLSFSRRQILAPEPLLPDRVVDGIHELLARTLGEQLILEVAPAPPGLWPLLADRNQVESALINLVINARDATPPCGRVTISFGNMRAESGGDGVPDDLETGDYVSIAVTDTGSGMSEETRKRVFEPFFTTKAPGAGTGLGLSQTYGFATQSKGSVHIKSTPGAGTTVTILLPRAIPVAGEEAMLRETSAEAPQGRAFDPAIAPERPAALAFI